MCMLKGINFKIKMCVVWSKKTILTKKLISSKKTSELKKITELKKLFENIWIKKSYFHRDHYQRLRKDSENFSLLLLYIQ